MQQTNAEPLATTGRSIPSWLIDAAVAAAVLAGSFLILGHGIGAAHPGSELDLRGAALVAIASIPLLWWRRAPLLVFATTAIASIVASALGYELLVPLGPTVALYLLAASRDETHRWTIRTTALVTVLFVAEMAAIGGAAGSFSVHQFLHVGLAWGVAWFAGERTRLVREQMAALKATAMDAQRTAERERLLAVAEERARIARDLHDSAGHAINVIAVRAGAARLRRDEPERSLAALETIEELARRTAGEIDQIVHSLRDVGERSTAPPGLASLGTLLEDHSRSGLEVALHTSGKARPLAKSADQAAYRILQEALTNAARHGAGSASVRLAFDTSVLELTVTNPVAGESNSRGNDGHGLIGMRERAALAGGSFDSRRARDSFEISVQLPLADALA